MGRVVPRLVQNAWSGNCNFGYFTGLSNYVGKPKEALQDLLFVETNNPIYDGTRFTGNYELQCRFSLPLCGMLLFAQDSDSGGASGKTPYAYQMEAYILEHGLGAVTRFEVPNPSHANRVGTLFVWVLDRAALEEWAKQNKPKGVK